MRPIALLTFLLAGAGLGFAPAPIAKENPRDPAVVLRNLQGTWRMTRYELAGNSMCGVNESYTVTIEKDQWTYIRHLNGGPAVKAATYSIKLDSKQTPPAIDFFSNGITLLGSYDLTKGKLSVVFFTARCGGKKRATNLKAPGPTEYFLFLER